MLTFDRMRLLAVTGTLAAAASLLAQPPDTRAKRPEPPCPAVAAPPSATYFDPSLERVRFYRKLERGIQEGIDDIGNALRSSDSSAPDYSRAKTLLHPMECNSGALLDEIRDYRSEAQRVSVVCEGYVACLHQVIDECARTVAEMDKDKVPGSSPANDSSDLRPANRYKFNAELHLGDVRKAIADLNEVVSVLDSKRTLLIKLQNHLKSFSVALDGAIEQPQEFRAGIVRGEFQALKQTVANLAHDDKSNWPWFDQRRCRPQPMFNCDTNPRVPPPGCRGK